MSQTNKNLAHYTNAFRGFTLIEMVLTIALLGIVGVFLGSTLSGSIRSYALVRDRHEMSEEMRLATERIKRDADLIASADEISTCDGSDFVFVLGGVMMTYAFVGNQITINGTVLAGGVHSLVFSCLDSTGAPASPLSETRRIYFEISMAPGAGAGGNLTTRSDVFLRNEYYDTYNKDTPVP